MPNKDPWVSRAPAAAGRSLVLVDPLLMRALADHARERAAHLSPWPLAASLTNGGTVWQMRLGQIARDPGEAVWVTRLLLHDGIAVGRAGFHGPPDAAGTVEIGYEVDPAHRRHGHARAAATILLDQAGREPAVHVVRACVSPTNLPSRSLVQSLGFAAAGRQWDEEDGWEDVFEIPAR